MQRVTIILSIVSFATAALLTALVRRFALARGVLDVPNSRSSHSTATPRGGGLAIVATATAALGVLAALGSVPLALFLALAGGGLVVAAVGFADDHLNVPAGPRLAVHVLAAAWAVWCLGGLGGVRVGEHVAQLGWAGGVLAVLAIVWTLNLFNFMDGIDAIAASEAIFVACAGAFLAAGSGPGGVSAAAWVFAGTCGGFLLWNWPPARIFMGDVGSGYLGYVIAVLGLQATHGDAAALWVWLILGAVFFVDATATLIRRSLRGERVHQAHRSHAYQWLSRRWGGHRDVTLLVLAVNLVWLVPWAILARHFPGHAWVMTLLALLPLAAAVIAAGAGRREESRGV
ncbi:MAG: glycosyltransferase family 4 protein [Steroidobacteraceae bacterium]